MGGRTAVRRDLEMVRLLDQTFAQIAANPTLVARATVPWQQVAQNAPAPAMAGFGLPQVSSNSVLCAVARPADGAGGRRRRRRIGARAGREHPVDPCRRHHSQRPANPSAGQRWAAAGNGPAVPPLVAKADTTARRRLLRQPRPIWSGQPPTRPSRRSVPPLREDAARRRCGTGAHPGTTGPSRSAPMPTSRWPRRSSEPMPARPRTCWRGLPDHRAAPFRQRPCDLPRPLRPVCRAGSARCLQSPDPARPDLLRGHSNALESSFRSSDTNMPEVVTTVAGLREALAAAQRPGSDRHGADHGRAA